MPQQNGQDSRGIADGASLAESLLARCRTLLNELEEFRSFIHKRNTEQEHAVDIRKFQTSVGVEYKSLQKLSEADLTTEKTIHTLRSSNLPFYAATWEAAKASKALVTFHKRFYWDDRSTRDSKKVAEKRCVLVDIVARDGEEWVKVSTVNEERLKFEIAKAEWEAADSSPSDGEETEDPNQINRITNGHSTTAENNDLERIELVQTADELAWASHAHRVHYKHPQIRFVLPKISASPAPELLPVLARVQSTGATVDLGAPNASPQDLNACIFPNLLPSPHPPLTNTLNVDCTILLALVSDLSHTINHPILPDYNAAIIRQIELERRDHLLPSSLWPGMAHKELVCTQEAAKRMREIVDTIGMPKERLRTNLLLADQSDADGEKLRQAFAMHSDHTVPSSWRLPIRIVGSTVSTSDIQQAVKTGALPPVAESVAAQLTDINQSVFLYGWMQGITTVSSNRTVAKQIEAIIEKEERGAMGPEVWLREPARSLLGKEKQRRK